MRAGDLLGGRFRLEAIAGSGAMGVVFRAVDLARGDTVAVKVLRVPAGRPDGRDGGDDVARFDREAQLLLALQHPGVVRYVAHGATPDREPFLVTEWLAGDSLKQRMERGPLGAEETIDVGLALASALAGAHGRGVVHRDVKPANVFLVGGSTARVKLLDFGVARVRTGKALTEAGATIGTPAYMSPEQARGDAEVDARSDVFSLGAVLFHLVTGRQPFPAHDVLSVLLRVATERADRVASVAPSAPPRLASLVDAMLAPLPTERPTTAQVFAALSAMRDELGSASAPSNVMPVAPRVTMVQQARFATRVEAPPPLRRAGPKPLVLAIVAAVALGAIGVGIALWLTLGTSTEDALARRKQRRAERASASASARAATSVSATARAGHPASASPSAPDFDSLPCDQPTWVGCEPAPFADLHAIDPSEFIERCLALSRRREPSSYLVAVSAPVLVDGRFDGTVVNHMCRTRTPDGRSFSTQILGSRLVAVEIAAFVADEPALPEHPCPVATAWSVASKRVRSPVSFLYMRHFLRHVSAVYMFTGSGTERAAIDAETCTETD